MKKALFIILPLLAIIIIGIFVFMNYDSDETQFNEDTAVGNSAGNLYNGGSMCEYGNRIYFSNPYDGDYLYVMDSDCTNIERLREEPCISINVYGNYIYYTKKAQDSSEEKSVIAGQRYGIMRCDLDGKDAIQLYDSYTTKSILGGNKLYYDCNGETGAFAINSVDIDGDNETIVSTDSFDIASMNDKKIYYSGSDRDHSVFSYDTETGVTSLFYPGNTYKASMAEGYLYYIDLSNGYALTKVNTKDNSVTVISDKKCINYNVIGITVYYQVEDDNSGLYRNNIYGTNEELIMYGNISSIFTTSQYTFFTVYGSYNLYRIETFDGDTVQTFEIGYE